MRILLTLNALSLVILAFSAAFASTEIPGDDPMMLGVVVLKVTPEYYVDIGDRAVYRLGVDLIDRFMDDIDAVRIERAYPHCLPPVPGGTNLAPIYYMYFSESLSVNDVCRDLLKLPCIEYAEPWWIHSTFPAPNDPLRDQQYGLNLCDANEAYEISTGDRRVPVAIVDTGVDLDHPDLERNIWVNPFEDLNGNGVIENNERNNRDDDNNGVVDDFYGWDFVNRNNNPNDTYGHGTHCAGIASAVTNNEVGIASVGYRCSIIAVRVGSAQSIPFGYQGIEYAVRVSAKVISCSWGGSQGGGQGRDVINYAVENDILVICAAGNYNSTRRHYPAGYDNAIAVAATDANDRKAGFSNYGAWIDISAPGVHVLSTYMGGGYRTMDGTSMACPFTASVALLIRSVYPDIMYNAARGYLLYGAEIIDDQNRGYEGQLGAGRINAHRSLMFGERPILVIKDVEVVEDENNNRHFEPGELVNLAVTISNSGGTNDAEEINVHLSTEDSTVTIINDSAELPDLRAGEEATNEDNPFEIEVAEDATPHSAQFTLRLTAEPTNIEITKRFGVLIGYSDVLIVDDDMGEENDLHYKMLIEETGRTWLSWDVSDIYSLDPDAMTQFPMIIWFTGNAEVYNDEPDLITLAYILEEGANILLVSNKIGDYEGNQEILETWFGARHEADSVGARIAFGVPGSPLAEADSMMLVGNDGSGEGRNSTTSMIPVDDADSLVFYKIRNQRDPTGCGAVYRIHPDTEARLMYFGFSLDGIATEAWYTRRSDVFGLICDWFMGDDDVISFDEDYLTPETAILDPAYPNPFNGMVRIDFHLPGETYYNLRILDLTGREVAVIRESTAVNGRNSAIWNSSGTPTGNYIVQLSIPGREPLTRKVALIK